MDTIKHLRKRATGGSLLSLALVLLLLVMTLVGLNTQHKLIREIRTQVRIRERLRDVSRSVGQLDLLHLRYRATGMALFRAGCEQITDSLNLQLKDLQALVKHDPSRAGQLRLIAAGIDTVQRYWQSSDKHAVDNTRQLALAEEKRLDVIRAMTAGFDELSRLQLNNLQQRQDAVMVQLRSWLVLLEILIASILLPISLRRPSVTRIRTFRAADHSGLPV